MTSGHTRGFRDTPYRKTVDTERRCSSAERGEWSQENSFWTTPLSWISSLCNHQNFLLIKALSLGSVGMVASAKQPVHKGTRESSWDSSRREGGVEGVKERSHDHITLAVPRSFSAYSNSVLVADAPLIVAPWWVSHNGLEIMIKAQDKSW